jgi:hypothetical protein
MFRQLYSFVLCAVVASTLGINAQAKEHKGVNFPDEIKVGDTNLKLNGTGVRTAMSIISVYVAGLYVATPSTDTNTIVNEKSPKKIDMHFLMSLGKDKLKDGWDEGFFRNAEKSYSYRADLNKFYDMLSNMKKGDRVQLTLFPDKTEIQVKDEPVQTIVSPEFSKTMLKVYIANIPDTGLKKGLLGLK